MMTSDKLVPRCLRWIIMAVSGVCVLCCTPTIESRGQLPAAEALAQIQPGVQTKDDVQVILGTPSSFSVFGEEAWYYISSREERFAFYPPQELERKVIVIRFDNKGMVKEIQTYGLEDGQLIEHAYHTTQAAGSEISLLKQLLGNVGRFNKSKQHIE